jgi:hypothetical protein
MRRLENTALINDDIKSALGLRRIQVEVHFQHGRRPLTQFGI